MDGASSDNLEEKVEKIRKRLWWLPMVWIEWDEDGEKWVYVKWSWEW